MKTIQHYFNLLFAGKPKKPKPQIKETVVDTPVDEPQKPQSTAFHQDDSPPGYKVRWHH